MKLFYSILLCMILLFMLKGCIDEPSIGENIQGKVYENWANRYYIIHTNENYFAQPDYYGIFHLSVSSKPYEVTLLEKWADKSIGVFKYNGLTINNIHLVTAEQSYIPEYYDYSNVLVTFPRPAGQKMIYLKFISAETYLQDRDYVYFSPEDNYPIIRIYKPPGNSSIRGRLYFLEATIDTEYFAGVLSYDKFGIKEITLSAFGNNNVEFSSDDINYDPPDVQMHININYPPLFKVYQEFYMSFFNGHAASDAILYPYLGYKVPVLPQSDFRIKAVLHYDPYSSVLDVYGKQWIYVLPGEITSMDYEESIELILPPDYAKNIADTSMFIIRDLSGPGPAVYEFNIGGDIEYRFYTNKKEVRFSEFLSSSFEFKPNCDYKWCVRKFPGYNNVDEFLSQPYTIDDRYSYIGLSYDRTFTTAP